MQRETATSDSPLPYFTALHFNSHMLEFPRVYNFILLSENSKQTSFVAQGLLSHPWGTRVLRGACCRYPAQGQRRRGWYIYGEQGHFLLTPTLPREADLIFPRKGASAQGSRTLRLGFHVLPEEYEQPRVPLYVQTCLLYSVPYLTSASGVSPTLYP